MNESRGRTSEADVRNATGSCGLTKKKEVATFDAKEQHTLFPSHGPVDKGGTDNPCFSFPWEGHTHLRELCP